MQARRILYGPPAARPKEAPTPQLQASPPKSSRSAVVQKVEAVVSPAVSAPLSPAAAKVTLPSKPTSPKVSAEAPAPSPMTDAFVVDPYSIKNSQALPPPGSSIGGYSVEDARRLGLIPPRNQ